jgi:GT2 family glycosyltransferase
MISEDIYVCRKLTDEGGFKIYLDPKITCNHVGGKKYKGDFLKWYNSNYKNRQSENKRVGSGIDYLNQFKNLY